MVKSSKRVTLKRKYKIERKCREHDRKAKRLAKANPDLVQRKKKADPGIPNLWPFKNAMLKEAINAKIEERERLDRERQIKKALKEREKVAAEQAELRRIAEYQRENTVEGKRKWYFRELMKVVEASDVILEVLDARDPLGCRAYDIERKIAGMLNEQGYAQKKVILVLNKIDMVPPEVAQSWVTYLRREYPTIAFKASTHKHRGHMNQLDLKSHKASQKVLDTKGSVGAPALLQLLKNYSRSADLKKGLTVGIIGYPNVGKSSIVNSLKMMRAVQVSSAAGCTKSLQQVRLDGNIMLVDSPGVLFSADVDNTSEEGQRNLLLRNALRLDQVEDPVNAIQGILERCSKEQLMDLYNIAEFQNANEFLIFVAHRRGKLAKGGIPQIEETARTVLQDWNEGKIPFYTVPPATSDIQESNVVTQFGEEFNIDALLDEANTQTVRMIQELGINKTDDGMGDDDVDDDDDVQGIDDDDDDDDGMGDDDDSYVQEYLKSNHGPLIVEESDSEDDGAADQQQERMNNERLHPVDMVPLRNLKVGRGKAEKVLDRDYGGAVAPVMTKQQKKQQQKKQAKLLAKQQKYNDINDDIDDDGEDYDFADY